MFDPSKMPDVEAGGNASDVHNLFCLLWHANRGDGIVSEEEFIDFHHDISAGIEEDEDFISLVATSW